MLLKILAFLFLFASIYKLFIFAGYGKKEEVRFLKEETVRNKTVVDRGVFYRLTFVRNDQSTCISEDIVNKDAYLNLKNKDKIIVYTSFLDANKCLIEHNKVLLWALAYLALTYAAFSAINF